MARGLLEQRIGRYEVQTRIGKGAMGEVFKARDPVLNRSVAIKIINANLVSDEQFRHRFLQEAQSAARLNHRNIVTVYEFNDADPAQVFMVMEFLEGSDLRDVIAKRSMLRVEDKLGIVEQVCEGLAYAHSKGIVHRDLKPANIRLLPNLTPKIMDFGLARLGTSEITRAGTVMGTPDYMSPEQVRAQKVDARSDIFSLGAVLYHFLANRKPFEQESVHSILYEVLERDPPPLRDLVPDLPPLVVPIVETALRKDPAKRYPNATALRDALRDARRAIAAGRAAAAAMSPGEEGEATITRLELPTPSYPSLHPTQPSLHGRSLAARPPSAPSLVSPPTIAPRSDSMTEGATALDMTVVGIGEGSTARPADTFVGSVDDLPAPRTGRMALVGAIALLLCGAAGIVVWQLRRSSADVAQRQELEDLANLQRLRHEAQLDLARSELLGKNYAKARQEAEGVLAEDPENADARKVVAEAQEAVAALDRAAAEARGAVAAGDTARAERALSQVLAIDPGHPVVAELSRELNQHFRTRTEEARGRAELARQAAQAAQAAGQPTFAAADRVLRDAVTRQQNGDFVEAAGRFSEAAFGFDRARSDAEASRVAQARAAETARLTAAIRPSALPSVLTAPATGAPGPAVPAPDRTPLAPTASAVPSPGMAATAPPFSLPVPPSSSVVPSLPTAPSTALGAGADVAVRRTLADYARALTTRDLALFKSVMPGITADQEKSLRESFKAIKSQQVELAVESIQVVDGKATVRLTRQDTLNGQVLKARSQTFRLVQRGGGWTIESIGQ